MKKAITTAVALLFCASFSAGKVDFTTTAAPKALQVTTGTKAVSIKENSSSVATNLLSRVPVNVIPISSQNEHVKDTDGTPQHEPCAAIRLTQTLILTANHCVADSFHNGDKLIAHVSITDDKKEGLVFSKPTTTTIIKPNAQVHFYRPNYHNTTSASREGISFDFAVIKLQPSMQYNPAGATAAAMQQASGLSPEDQQKLLETALKMAKKQFLMESSQYKKFMNIALKKFDLLEMSPDVVVPELEGKKLTDYFWNGYQFSSKRDPVRIYTGKILGPDFQNGCSHCLRFALESHSGTSGSPILDVSRNLVVSVMSVSDETKNISQGGLISDKVCNWVKSHDSRVKCVCVIGGGEGAIYEETDETANWGK